MPGRKSVGYVEVNENIRSPVAFNEDAGTVSGDEAAAGDTGEFKSASLGVGAATALVSATPKTITSVVLTPGDWDIDGVVDFVVAATTSITALLEGSSSVNNALDADDTYSSLILAAFVPGAVTERRSIPRRRVNVSQTSTLYLVASATFTVAGISAHGTIKARRVR